MNLRQMFLLLLMCAGNVALSNNFDEESLRKMSLPELKALSEEISKKDLLTPEHKVYQQEREQLDLLQWERISLDVSCAFSCVPVISYFVGSSEDCQKAERVREEIFAQKARVRDANSKFNEANPEWILVATCIRAKEYED